MIDADIGLSLLRGGVCVIPTGIDKKPCVKWKQYETQLPSAEQVTQWAGLAKTRGFAAVGGAVSDGLLILDFDADGFYEGWKQRVAELADGLPVQRTGGGGYQVWLRCDQPGKNDKLAWVENETQDTGRSIAIETRAEGGYAVGPGSFHPSGKKYESLAGDFASIPRLPMDVVNKMIAAAKALDQCPLTIQQRRKIAAAPPRYAAKLGGNGKVNVIAAYNVKHDVSELLAAHGYQRRGERFIRPGAEALSVPGVVILDGGKSYHHSSNDPLNNGHCHDPFSIFCELDHGGDVGAAVKAAAVELGLAPKPWPTAPQSLPQGSEPDLSHDRHQTWFDLDLSLNHNGGPHPNLDNACRLMERHPMLVGRVWWDEFHERIFTRLRGPEKEWSDSDDIWMQRFIQREVGIPKIGLDAIRSAADLVARQNTRNEPKDWMETLNWDGMPRLVDLMHRGFGAEENEYTRRVGECFMLGMVARVLNPGCKVDTLPIFEGAQGALKGSALKDIGGKWFAECHEQMTHKDFYGIVQGKMLVEISELHAFTRSEIEKVKGIITCQVDRYRSAYDRRTSDHLRQGVFAGTTNRDDWNRDDTGARRFWPIRCGTISRAWIQENRDQLFAEAIARYRTGDNWWIIPLDLARQEQEDRRPEDPWSPLVNGILAQYAQMGSTSFYMSDLLIALKIPSDRQDRATATRVGILIRDAGGWAKKKGTVDGGRVYFYEKT